MSSQNRPIASSSMSPNQRVRQLWLAFEKSLSKPRSLMEHRVNAVTATAEKEYERTSPTQRMSQVQHNIIKARLAKTIQEPYFEKSRGQWEDKLTEAGLRMEDWADITEEEMQNVLRALGNSEDDSDEDMVVVREPPAIPSLTVYPTTYLQPLAPSISTSTRATNISSTSSYALVDPSAFHSEDEDAIFFLPVVATSHDLTSDDDDASGAANRRPRKFDAWSDDSEPSSMKNSVESSSALPSVRPTNNHTASFNRSTSASQQAAAQSSASPNAKIPRQPYIGPSLSDPDEPLSDEEDFERFKMTLRIQKIVEFHQAAALADIQLAVAIYKDRKAQNSDKQEVSSKVIEHQKHMSQLQMEKEEERKNVVKTERSKRRTELRQRPGRSGTLIAPIPSVLAQPAWLNDFQEQATGQLDSQFDLQRILSDDPDEQGNNTEKFLQQLFPGSSAAFSAYGNEVNPSPKPFNQNQFSSSADGWNMPSASTPATFTSASQASQPRFSRRRLSDAQLSKVPPMRRSRPSLFGDDESSDEEEESSPPPPAPAPAVEHMNPFMSADASAFLSNQLMADSEIASALNQWTRIGEIQNASISTLPAWSARQAVQTPTADNPNPWGTTEARATPVSSGWARRKPSFSSPQSKVPQSSFNPFGMGEPSEPPLSLAAMAALNSANIKGKRAMAPTFDHRAPLQQEMPKDPSPSLPTVSAPFNKSPVAPPPAPVQATVDKPAPVPQAPSGKKLNKKQRQAMKKPGGAVAAAEEQQEPNSNVTPTMSPTETTPVERSQQGAPAMAGSFFGSDPISSMAKMIPGISRVRKDSSTAWDEAASTPRPTPKTPAHLQEQAGAKSEGASRPGMASKSKMADILRGESSTIKGPQWGSAATPAVARSAAWNIFSSSDSAPSKAPSQPTTNQSRSSSRDPWVPGGFDGDDADDGGGFAEEMPQPATQHFWTPPSRSSQDKASTPPKQQPISSAQRLPRANDTTPAPAINSRAAVSSLQQQAAPSPAGGKKGKGKKGKGRKVTVEEVQDEEPDSRGESLPVDSRYIMEPKVIVEPKPSIPPTTYDSIISFGDEDEEESNPSSFAPTPSTAPSSPPDPFEGDEGRLAAAIKELQHGTAQLERKFGGGWSTPAPKQHATWTPSLSEPEGSSPAMFSPFGRASAKPTSSTPIWGAFGTSEKSKGSSVDLAGAATIQNLKRSKVGAGGKLF